MHIWIEGEDQGTHLHKVRRNVGYSSYPREEESHRRRVTLHTVQAHMPPAATHRCQVESAGGNHEGGTTQGDSLSRSLGTPRQPSLLCQARRDANSPPVSVRDARQPVLKLVDRLLRN